MGEVKHGISVLHPVTESPFAADSRDSQSSAANPSTRQDTNPGAGGVQTAPSVAPRAPSGAEEQPSQLNPRAPTFRVFGSPLRPAPLAMGSHLEEDPSSCGDGLQSPRPGGWDTLVEQEYGSH